MSLGQAHSLGEVTAKKHCHMKESGDWSRCLYVTDNIPGAQFIGHKRQANMLLYWEIIID